MKTWLDNALRIRKYAPINVSAAIRASIREWANLPAVSGRSLTIRRIVRTSGDYWQVTALNASTDNLFLNDDKKVVSIPNHLIKGDDDKDLRNCCNTLARQLCSLFDRCPIPSHIQLSRMLVRLAMEMLYPDEKPRAVWATISQRKGTGTVYNIIVWFIDPNTSEIGPYSPQSGLAPPHCVCLPASHVARETARSSQQSVTSSIDPRGLQ